MYPPARLHRLAKSIPWNGILAPKTFHNTGSGGPVRYPCWLYRPARLQGWRNRFLGIESSLLKRLQILVLLFEPCLVWPHQLFPPAQCLESLTIERIGPNQRKGLFIFQVLKSNANGASVTFIGPHSHIC
jgi:hypothetical protein